MPAPDSLTPVLRLLSIRPGTGRLTYMASDYHGRRLGDIVVVRLTHKFAQMIDGVDLSPYSVGDTAAFPAHAAGLLIAEGWAVPVGKRRNRRQPPDHAVAADRMEVSTASTGELIRQRLPAKPRVARAKRSRQNL